MESEFTNKILLIDDDREILDQIKIELENENENIEVIPASSASEALKILKNEDCDAIVSNYQMSEMGGIEFLNEIRWKKGIKLPFILFTEKKNQEIVLKVLKRGGSRVLHLGEDVILSCKVLAEALRIEIQHYERKKELQHHRNEYRKHYRIFES